MTQTVKTAWTAPALRKLGTIGDVRNVNSGTFTQSVCSGSGGSLCKS